MLDRASVLITDTLITDYFSLPEDQMENAEKRLLRLALRRIDTDGWPMRTTVMIDDDVYVKVRQMAEDSGRTFGQVISQLARKGLLYEPLFETEVPVFRVLIGAAMIPGNRAGAA